MKSLIRSSLLALLLVMPLRADAQERTISVSSNVDSAAVFIDGAWAGRVSDSPFSIPADAGMVMVQLPWLSAWSVQPLLYELAGDDVQDIEFEANFPYHYRFESIPSGAVVSNGDARLGRTPFVHSSAKPLIGPVRVELDGYLDAVPELGDNVWNLVRMELTPDASSSMAIGSDHIVPKPRKDWVSIAATASAFAAGAMAIHFRTKADNRFDDYQISGKESLRSDIQRFDVQSGVALGVMHAGLGVVVFRLAF